MIQLMKNAGQIKKKYTNCIVWSTNAHLEAVNYDGTGVFTIPGQLIVSCLSWNIVYHHHLPEVDHGKLSFEFPEPDMPRIHIVTFMHGGVDGDPSHLSHINLVPVMMAEIPTILRRVDTTPDHPGRNTWSAAKSSQQVASQKSFDPSVSVLECKLATV